MTNPQRTYESHEEQVADAYDSGLRCLPMLCLFICVMLLLLCGMGVAHAQQEMMPPLMLEHYMAYVSKP